MAAADRHEGGFTLIELVISMVVVAIALGGVLMVINYSVRHSADPMLQHQAVAIAESYLEEVLLRPYKDPDGSDGETVRNLLDDVDDYEGWSDAGARDQEGTAISGLEAYRISVAVDDATLNTVACKKVTVTVRHAGGIELTLSGYRMDY